jgi:predicted dehydrogenase
MTGTRHKILIIGLGDVAATHLTVLEQIPDAQVVAGVDIEPKDGLTFRGRPLPVYQSLGNVAGHHQVDVVVIATPTPTHAAVCTQIAEILPAARILVEKPAADTLTGARQVLQDIGSRQPVDVAYHMAFAPEVSWALRTTQAAASALGPPVSARASFADPYDQDFQPAATRLGNSWIDSGINALSVLRRFTDPADRTSLRRIGDPSQSVFEAHITCRTGTHDLDALILTSWHVTDPAKTTTIRYSSGAELVMDHTAVAAYLVVDGRVSDLFGANASIPRRERHYHALYQSWLTEGQPIATPRDHLLLHELLLSPSDTIPA